MQEIFSKRQIELRGEMPDVYTYDQLSEKLKTQILYILSDSLGKDIQAQHIYESVVKVLCREYGLVKLNNANSPGAMIANFLRDTNDIECNLDLIELLFQQLNSIVRHHPSYRHYRYIMPLDCDAAIDQLNKRFREHRVGFQFVSNQIIKIDSTYTHSEVIRPALNLLSNEKFTGANEEFMKAHEHYLEGRNKECLTDCLKAFESTMKIICHEKGWQYDPKDTVSKLINTCFNNNLVPAYTQNQFSSLQNMLISGIPTIRNKLGAHGQGVIPQKVDDEMVRYMLNLTATNILLLVELSQIE